MKRNELGQMVIENEKDVRDIIEDRVDMNPDLDGPDGDIVGDVCEPLSNYDEIEELRASIKAEHEYLRSLDVEDVETRRDTIDNICRMSDQIAALDV